MSSVSPSSLLLLLLPFPSSLPKTLTLKPSPALHFAGMKGRPPSSNGGVYVPPHHRLRSVITCQNYTSPASFDSIPKNPKPAAASVAQPEDHFPRPSSPYISAYDDAFSEEGSDRELDSSLHPGAGPSDNIDQWKRKLTMLLRDKDKQELISREKKDRLDFEQIAILASRMGLHSHLYAKVVVVSKVPLPNYRFDLDDRRPQREVTLPLGLLRRVEAHVSEFLSQKSRTNERFLDFSFSRSSSNCSIATDDVLFEAPEPLASSIGMMDKILCVEASN